MAKKLQPEGQFALSGFCDTIGPISCLWQNIDMDTNSLVYDLVSIPSYVSGTCNEIKIGQYIFKYLQRFSWLRLEKQQVGNGRFNVIAKDKYPTKTIICGHIDTVEPRGKWQKPKIVGNKLYGLGSSDMKCTIAAMLSAIDKFGPTKGIMWLFYIDEEYDFLGMEKFIAKYKKRLKPHLIIGEGSDCQLTNGCRGCIEVKFTVYGKTGHAARPSEGNNAIVGANSIIQRIMKEVGLFTDPVMGKSTVNVASINGGLNLGQSNSEINIGRQGNNIADYCQFILDIRNASFKLRAKTIVQIAQKTAKKLGLNLEFAIKHDKIGWLSPTTSLPKEISANYPLVANYQTGYLDIQMLNQAFGCPCFGFGAGLAKQAHKQDEFVLLKNLKICTEFYIQLVSLLKGVKK